MPPNLRVHGTERVVKEIDVSILVHSSDKHKHKTYTKQKQILWYYSNIAVKHLVLQYDISQPCGTTEL